MRQAQGYGYVLGADGKVHEASFHIYGGGLTAMLDPDIEHPKGRDGYPLAAMRPITYQPEIDLFDSMGRMCELCFDES